MDDRFKFRVWDDKRKLYTLPGDLSIDADGELWENCTCLDNSDNHLIIEQCTGVTDKNGKLIYEGDVVCYDDTPYNAYATKKTGVVVYRKAEFCYKYSDCFEGLYQPLVPSDDFWQRKTKIIGNIHEMDVTK